MILKTYMYPDGTKSIHRPRDGMTFSQVDPFSMKRTDWQYDGFIEQWVKVAVIDDKHRDLVPPARSKSGCECGSEKCGSNRHSSWCPQFAN